MSLAAHCPGVGVNIVVNVPSELLLIGSGDHVPVKPSLETNGNASTLPVTQYGPSCVKVGVVGAVISQSLVHNSDPTRRTIGYV